jgi:hypothetical protein
VPHVRPPQADVRGRIKLASIMVLLRFKIHLPSRCGLKRSRKHYRSDTNSGPSGGAYRRSFRNFISRLRTNIRGVLKKFDEFLSGRSSCAMSEKLRSCLGHTNLLGDRYGDPLIQRHAVLLGEPLSCLLDRERKLERVSRFTHRSAGRSTGIRNHFPTAQNRWRRAIEIISFEAPLDDGQHAAVIVRPCLYLAPPLQREGCRQFRIVQEGFV